MTVSFHNGELHLPNGQAYNLLVAIGVAKPITTTHGNMSVASAVAGVLLALKSNNKEPLATNLQDLRKLLEKLDFEGIEDLEWS